ncbi:uncharacterized protein LOC135611549 [Musa acuminata AAA Group]|uniref:uncharacterized protein LOC135611549 n=1 Tax=Musa acuminata AAA Group TaxID=214697 RepID=UPI0031DF695B
MLPPHEIVARASGNGSPMIPFSVLKGAGRTLKGRDLRRVRNVVLQKTERPNALLPAAAATTLLAAPCAAGRGCCPRLQAARPLAALPLQVGALAGTATSAGGSAGGAAPAGGASPVGVTASVGGSARGATPAGGAVPLGDHPCGGVSPAGAATAGAAALRRLTLREKRS